MYHDGVYEWRKDMARGFLLIEDQWLPVNVFIGIDPATDIDTQTADDSAIVAVAIDVMTNVYVLEYRVHRNIPTLAMRDEKKQIVGKEGILDIALAMNDKYHARHCVIEDVAMNRSCFVLLNQGRSNRNSILYDRWDFKAIPEAPAGKGSKRSRIYSSMHERFTSQKVHVRKTHDDLIDEIIMLGPRMKRDNIVEALHLACLRSYPPDPVKYSEYDNHGKQPIRKKKSWIVM